MKETNNNKRRSQQKDFKKSDKPKDGYSSKVDRRPNMAKKSSYDEMCTNDISWYNKMSNLFARATQVPFNRILGDNMAEPDINVGEFGSDNQWFRTSIPLVMRIGYMPGIGICTDYNDAPNRAFQAMYSALLTKTSTSVLPFTAANLALYTVCAQSIAQNIGVAKRLIETARVYTPDNYGLPRAYLAAQMLPVYGGSVTEGIEDLINNIGKYEWELNNVIRDFNSLRIPNFIDTFKRQYLLAHSYFMDNDTVASQAYVFMPKTFYKFNDLGLKDSEGNYDGIARAVSESLDATTFTRLLNDIKEQISSLRSSKDFTSINGTLKRAFDESSFVRIDELVGNETPNFIVDDVMAYQIHNLTVCPVQESNLADIVADYERDIIVYNPYSWGQNFLSKAQNFILNTFDNSVTPDWIMESTRLVTIAGDNESVYTCGTEIVTEVAVAYLQYTEQGTIDNVQIVPITDTLLNYRYSGDHASDMRSELAFMLPLLEKFHRGPRFAVYGPTSVYADNDFGEEEKNTLIAITGDLHFYTFASRDAIKRLHDTALLSIFDTTASMNVK